MDALIVIGLIICVIGGIGFLIAAFRESILWGLGCLLFTPVSLVFLVLHWQEARSPFFLQLIGWVIVFGGASIGAGHV